MVSSLMTLEVAATDDNKRAAGSSFIFTTVLRSPGRREMYIWTFDYNVLTYFEQMGDNEAPKASARIRR